MGGEEQECWVCHRQPNWNGIEGSRASITFCQDCHGDPQVDQDAEPGRTPVYVDPGPYQDTLHAQIACVGCHTDVARNPHRGDQAVACRDCHAAILDHVNMGAPHMSTDCAACHLLDSAGQNLPVVQDAATGQVLLASVDAAGAPLDRTAARHAQRGRLQEVPCFGQCRRGTGGGATGPQHLLYGLP